MNAPEVRQIPDTIKSILKKDDLEQIRKGVWDSK